MTTDRVVFPQQMYLPVNDPAVKGPTAMLIECCEICFCLLPKHLSPEHKRWHLSQERGTTPPPNGGDRG